MQYDDLIDPSRVANPRNPIERRHRLERTDLNFSKVSCIRGKQLQISYDQFHVKDAKEQFKLLNWAQLFRPGLCASEPQNTCFSALDDGASHEMLFGFGRRRAYLWIVF